MNDVFLYVNDNGDSLIFSTSNGYAVKTISGTSGNTVNVSTAQGVGQVGASVQSRVVDPAPMTVTGVIFGNHAQAKARAERLLQVILPGVDGKLYHNGSYYRVVTPTATPVIETKRKFPQFQFSLLAAYPYWTSVHSTQTMLTGVLSRFKFPWNISKAYRYGEAIATAYMNIRNNGQVACPFTVTFDAKGPVENPRLINVITGEYMQLLRTLAAGERVVVRLTHDRTYVTSTIDGDIRGDLDIDNTLWSLTVGDNLIKPEADSGLSSLVVKIDVSTEKAGIFVC